MANLSYCRFRNTLKDLKEAYDYLTVSDKDLSLEEKTARDGLIQVCKDITEEFCDD